MSNQVDLQIRNTLTGEGVAVIELKLGINVVRFDSTAAVQVAMNLLGAAYAARAEESIYKATYNDNKTLQKSIRHLRSIK